MEGSIKASVRLSELIEDKKDVIESLETWKFQRGCDAFSCSESVRIFRIPIQWITVHRYNAVASRLSDRGIFITYWPRWALCPAILYKLLITSKKVVFAISIANRQNARLKPARRSLINFRSHSVTDAIHFSAIFSRFLHFDLPHDCRI